MKIIKYKLCNRVNHGTEENPKYEDFIIGKEIRCSSANLEANEAIAKAEAYNGEYTVEDDGQHITAPHNIMEGEYVTIGGVLYLATQNIPNGEPVIVGQNAVVTTVEEQLYELTKEE